MQSERREGQWINLRSWIVVDKCTKRDACVITVASKRYATRKKKLDSNKHASDDMSLASSAFGCDVHSYTPTYRRHLLPSTADKTYCSIRNIPQSGQTIPLTFFKSFCSNSRIPIGPKTDIQKIILRATIISWQQHVLVSYHLLFSLFSCWFRPLLISPHINESTETTARASCQKVLDNVRSVLCHFQAGHSWCLALCFWFFHACGASSSTAPKALASSEKVALFSLASRRLVCCRTDWILSRR